MNNPKILIIDALSITHVGNAALLDSTLEQLKSQFNNAQFTILAFDPGSLSKISNNKMYKTLWADPFSLKRKNKANILINVVREFIWASINLLNFAIKSKMKFHINPKYYTFSPEKLNAIEAYTNADIVISISGEALQDDLIKRLPFFLYGYLLAHVMGKIVAIFPQSIGPLNKKLSITLTSYVLRKCDLVFPRDHFSLETAKKLGIKSDKLYLVPDVAVNQPFIKSSFAKELLKNEGVLINKKPLIGMAISKWKGINFQKYFPIMIEIANYIVAELKAELVLFSPNMPYQNEESDFQLSNLLYSKITLKDNVKILKNLYTPREFKGMLGELDVFITTRMHSSILSTMIGTPTISLVTQPKLLGYMKMINHEYMAVPIDNSILSRVTNLLDTSLKNHDNIKKNLLTERERVGKDAMRASEILKKIYIGNSK